MPPQIGALPRDKRGYPVPYVAERHGETVIVSDQYGPVMYVKWAQPERYKLGLMDPKRQRQCMEKHLCQVCGTALDSDRPWIMVGGMEYDRRLKSFAKNPDGGASPTYFTEPPVCPSCATYALQVCPGFLANKRKPDNLGGVKMGVYLVAETTLAWSCVDVLQRDVLYQYKTKHPLGVRYYTVSIPNKYKVFTIPDFLALGDIKPFLLKEKTS